MNWNNVTDISAISQLNKIDVLYLDGCQSIENWERLTWSPLIKNIKYLSLHATNIENLDFLNDAPNLSQLSLKNCDIKDICILSSLDNLGGLDLSGDNIEDISALELCDDLFGLTVNKYTFDNNPETINKLTDKGCKLSIVN